MLKSICLFLLLAFTTPIGCADAALSPQLRAAQSVVDLQYVNIYGEMHYFCTGVAVGKHTIMTQKHCLRAAEQHNTKIFYNGEWCPGDHEVGFDGKDVVLVHTCQEFQHYSPITGYVPKVGEHVFEYGHPLGGVLAYREGYLSYMDVEDGTRGMPSGHVWYWDMNATHGDSGGPIFSKDGKLICTTSFGIVTDERYGMNACYPPWFSKQALASIE